LANTRQQRKRVRVASRQRLENLRYKSAIKTLFKRVRQNLAAGDEEAARGAARSLTSTIDKGAARKAIHRNNAAHKKSRLARMLAER